MDRCAAFSLSLFPHFHFPFLYVSVSLWHSSYRYLLSDPVFINPSASEAKNVKVPKGESDST
jgi:hypothetical protein